MSFDKFLKVYSNLPFPVRKEIVVIMNDQPISWDVAYLEIKNKTKLGKKIQKKLEELDII